MPAIHELPSALEDETLNPRFSAALNDRRPALFLDYDGTLAAIAAQPEQARLGQGMAQQLLRLSDQLPLAIVSGRDRADVADFLGELDVIIAGSHGLDIAGPGFEQIRDAGAGYRDLMDETQATLEQAFYDLEGLTLEIKRSSIAVHFRNTDHVHHVRICRFMDDLVAKDGRLKMTPGKMVREVLPKVDWHKGKAVQWLVEALNLNPETHLPIYIGDDVTDEDAFVSLKQTGIGIIVADPTENDRQTEATFALKDVAAVERFLKSLA